MIQSYKKLVIGIFLIFIFSFLLVTGFYLINKNDDNKYGEELTIANLTDHTKDMSSNKDSLDYIQYDLFRVVNLNQSKPVESNSVTDILIRDGTFSQKTDNKTGVTTVTFIVDIKSLKQSYGVSYQWDSNGKRLAEGIDEWGTVVKCLPKEDLIYGDFSCKDMFTELSSERDPLLDYLPYNTLSFDMEGKYGIDENTGKSALYVIITIRLSELDYRMGEEQAIRQYSNEALDYIRSKGFNPDDYIIEYEY